MPPPTPDPHILFPYDFYHFWAAGKVAVTGGNPYDKNLVYEQMLSAGWPLSEGFHGFLHPPWSMWIFVPLGTLSFHAAVIMWALFSLLISVSCFALTKKWISERVESPGPLPLVALAFTCATFPPLMSTLWLGQTNILILLGITLFAHFAGKRKDLLGGIALSLVLIKPQLFIAFFCALLVFLLKSGRIGMILGLILGFFTQALTSFLLAPQALPNFLDGAKSLASSSVALPGSSLAQTLHLVIPQLWIFPLVSICGVSAALWLSLREKGDALRHLLFVSLPLSLLTAPYVWSHSFLPLLLPYLALISSRLQLQEARTIRAHTAFSLLGVCEVVKPLQLAPLMALLPSSILAFGLQGKRPQLPEKLSLK